MSSELVCAGGKRGLCARSGHNNGVQRSSPTQDVLSFMGFLSIDKNRNFDRTHFICTLGAQKQRYETESERQCEGFRIDVEHR